MKLLTKAQKDRLSKNGWVENRGKDHVPVVKLFNPVGSGTWLLTELEADGDRAFGLCDLGMGCPELGYVSLKELESLRLPLGLKIERDIHWEGDKPMSEYADMAQKAGGIVD